MNFVMNKKKEVVDNYIIENVDLIVLFMCFLVAFLFNCARQRLSHCGFKVTFEVGLKN